MADWVSKLDEFLKMSDSEILTHVGKISHQQATQKAIEEYEKYTERTKNELSEVEKHFLESIDKTAKKLKGKKGKCWR
ncbi:RhuM family protein [Tepidibacillus infernus]|uniref:RhuM family protein n=1 Tax=Tepidibacillus infernus TaxID=1806172 RepID=UPI003B6CEEC1